MHLILLEDVANLGKSGEKVKVKSGYGRNYLIPQKKALLATDSALRVYENQQKIKAARVHKERRHAETLKADIEKLSLTAAVQAGEDNKLFGSVTSMEIQRLLAEHNIEVDRRKILLDEPLRELGIFNVPIKLHPEIEAQVKIWVVKA